MPAASDTPHRLIDDLAIPYRTFDSLIASEPAIEVGKNVMTSIRKVAERRPGFSQSLEPVATTFNGRIANIYTWRKRSGSFFCMLAHVTANASEVWKLEIGVDESFVLIHTQAGTLEPYDFIAMNNMLFFGNGTVDGNNVAQMWRYDGVNVRKWGIAAPTLVAGSNLIDMPGGLKSSVDYHLFYTYYDQLTGHESSVGPISNCLPQFTDKAIRWTVYNSGDPQVSHIRMYRTRDGGSTDPRQMQEILGSPIANNPLAPGGSVTIDDFTADADLRNRFGPPLRVNDPPPPLRGFKPHGKRIYGIRGHEVWFSGFDEVINGMKEQCFKGGDSGNFWPFDDEVEALQSLAGDNSGMGVWLPSSIHKIDGEYRNEMRTYCVDEYHGARARKAVFGVGSEVGWFDISQQMRTSGLGEISTDIRPDLAALNPESVAVTPHIAGLRNWLCCLGTVSGNLFVLDSDTQMWQVPWPLGASAIHSGEIARGRRVLMAAIGGEIWYMLEGTWNDRGTAYAASLRTNLIPLAPPDNPDKVMAVDAVSIERNSVDIQDIKVSLDEAAHIEGALFSIKVNEGDPTHRTRGSQLVERRFTIPNERSVAKRMTIDIAWAAQDTNFELYSIDAEIHPYE